MSKIRQFNERSIEAWTGEAWTGQLVALCLLAVVIVMGAPHANAQLLYPNQDNLAEAKSPDEWLTSRWSWILQWESTSAPFLVNPSLIIPPASPPAPETGQGQSKEKVGGQPSIEALRRLAIASLTRASQQGRPSEVRQQAVLALGQIGGAQSTERLLQLLTDKDDRVSEVAWLSLGLARTDKARQKLIDPGTLSVSQTLGWTVAIALLPKPSESVLRTLAALVKQDRDLDVSRMALWALRQHNPPGLHDAAKLIAHQSNDPFMASQAILILGQDRQTTDLSRLKGILLTRGRGTIKASETLATAARGDIPSKVINILGGKLAAIRVSAAMALGQYVIPPEDKYSQRARGALRQLFESPPTPLQDPRGNRRRYLSGFGYTAAMPYDIRFAAGALGHNGFAQDAELLIRILRTPRLADYTGQAINARFFARRGFAALALGNYLRRMTDLGIVMASTDGRSPTQLSAEGDPALWRNHGPLQGEDKDQTRYMLRKVLRSLIDTASDPKEPYDLRAACVLALGMSNSPARQADVRTVLASPGGQPPLVKAYGVLALGLLGDDQTLSGASELLKASPTPALTLKELLRQRFSRTLHPGQIMAVRAILQGVGKIESPVAIDLAKKQFGQEPWTSRQAVLTLRLLGDTSLVAPLSELLDHEKQLARDDQLRGVRAPAPPDASQVAQLAAWSLGQLLRPGLNDPLADAFLLGENYTLPLSPQKGKVASYRRNNAIYRFRCYADPFFYEMLSPSTPVHVDVPFRN